MLLNFDLLQWSSVSNDSVGGFLQGILSGKGSVRVQES